MIELGLVKFVRPWKLDGVLYKYLLSDQYILIIKFTIDLCPIFLFFLVMNNKNILAYLLFIVSFTFNIFADETVDADGNSTSDNTDSYSEVVTPILNISIVGANVELSWDDTHPFDVYYSNDLSAWINTNINTSPYLRALSTSEFFKLLLDSDQDGVPDVYDAFPLDPNESQDTDSNGVGDNADSNMGTTSRWGSDTHILKFNGEDAMLKGFSGTTTEYLFDGLGMNTFWDTDFSTPFQATTSRISLAMLSQYGRNNFSTIYENDIGNSGASPDEQNVANRYFSEGIVTKLSGVDYPVFRIPMTARYWLNGGKNIFTYTGQVIAYDPSTRNVTYEWGSTGTLTGAVEVVEENGVFHLVQTFTAAEYQSYITDLIFYIKEELPNAVVILDLHWNFDRFGDSSTFETINDETTDSAFYARQLPMALDRDSSGSQVGSALLFWESVSETFGYREDSLVNGEKTNEAADYENYITFGDNSAVDRDYASDIWFELYNEPYTDKFSSYTINGAVPFPTDDVTDSIEAADWNGFLHGLDSSIDDATTVGMLELYTTVRARADNHVLVSAGSNYAWGAESLVALHAAIDADHNVDWDNVIFNVHPYMGFYQKGDSSKNAAGFYAVVTTLRRLNTPLMITEFGQYDGPDKINYDVILGIGDDPEDNWNFTEGNDISVTNTGNANRYQWYHYFGFWDRETNNESGTPMSYTEALLQICDDNQISWSAWASRPNSFAAGDSIGATQPDVFTGVDNDDEPDFQLTNPTTGINPQHQSQPMVKGSATGGGANWAYLWDHYGKDE